MYIGTLTSIEKPSKEHGEAGVGDEQPEDWLGRAKESIGGPENLRADKSTVCTYGSREANN